MHNHYSGRCIVIIKCIYCYVNGLCRNIGYKEQVVDINIYTVMDKQLINSEINIQDYELGKYKKIVYLD